jgi:Zn-dependent alcohol dehydrogenase
LEISKPRGERALAMGATVVINPKEVDPVKQVCELTAGVPPTLEICVAGEVPIPAPTSPG